ncbi:MAG TPA: integrase arm-type DNA-binding domain-containing protein [Steroidobacteraceae bacterium]|nr:integrase arm-type DNA-binding domain-containing protein [Steroidobacteraceae bacterium]
MEAGLTRLTKARVESLRPGGKQRDISDPERRGLVLRIEPSGSKLWLFRYKFAGKPHRLALGAYPGMSLALARAEAQAHRELLDRGLDPRTARRARRPTALSEAAGRTGKHSIEFLAHEFLERHVRPNRRRPEYVERILARDVLPEWQGRDARTITPREVIELLDGIVARGSRVMANRTASLLAQMFKFGIHRAIVENSPVMLLYRPGGKERPRSRALADEELRAFLQNLDEACRFQRLPHILRVLLLTLQRRSELTLAEWREFDFKAKTWTIPDEHAKTGRGHVVPLSDWTAQELQKLKVMADGSRYVLPGSDKSQPIDPKYITRSVARCLKRFKKHGVDAFTPHDLRRTGRTGLARLGIKVEIAERVVNHARERMEATYDVHDYLDEKREALDKWANHLAEIRDGQESR